MSSNIDLLIDWFNDTIISYGNDKQLLIKNMIIYRKMELLFTRS